MLQSLTLFLFLITLLASKELPQTFTQLSSPLYNSSKPINKLSSVENLKEMLKGYTDELDAIKALGYEVDASKNNVKSQEYLKILRKFQKKYDFILHEIHMSINKSIDNNNYKLFVKLTNYEFDGLLKSRALLTKALKFYEQNRSKKKIVFLEKKMQYKKIEIATTKEFYNEVSSSKYSSTSKSSDKNKKLSMEVVDVGSSLIVYIQNNNPYTITVKLKAKYKGLDYDRSIRKEFPLKAGIKKEYIRLHKKRRAMSYSYSYSYTWIIGSVDAVHDDNYVYRLPFAKGTSHRVSQGYNGKATHKGHSQYAIDFAMKTATKIYASREGVVVKTKENSNKGGYDKKFASSGNYITIEHSDTTFATYYHLKKNGVVVKVGDKVRRGAFIGYSGNTGYSSGPHLHFAIFKASDATKTRSIPIKLLSEKGIISIPKKGVSYTAK